MKRRRASRGQTMVEFALIVPMFLALVFALVDVGRAVVLWNVLSNVTSDGAHYEAIHAVNAQGSCDSSLVTMSQLRSAALASAQPFAAGITLTTPSACATDAYGTYYVVTATSTFQPVTTVILQRPITLTASSKTYVYLP